MEYRAMIINKWNTGDNGCVDYRLSCDCCDGDHDIIVSFDKEFDLLTVDMYANVSVINPYWSEYGLASWKRIWWNFKTGIKLVFGCNIEFQHDFIIGNKKHLDSVIKVLNEGKKMMAF